MGFWREFYSLLGWDYWDAWCPRQRQLKYQVCLQIQKSNLKLRKIESPANIEKHQFIKYKVSKKKVRIAPEVQYAPTPTVSPVSNRYALLNEAEHNNCVTELKTLFKNKRKNNWNNKKSWKRKHALSIPKIHKE
jgi:hypothetical protein